MLVTSLLQLSSSLAKFILTMLGCLVLLWSEVPAQQVTPGGRIHVHVSVIDNPEKELFNNIKRTTRRVRITGFVVIFDANDQSNKLHARFDNQPDIKELWVFADTLIVRNPLRLPQTNVWIYARELYFEDQPGQNESCIDTTPKNEWLERPPLTHGEDGHRGGDIHVIAKSVPKLDGVRFIAKGGNGQNAGAGRLGKNGRTLLDRSFELTEKIKSENWTAADQKPVQVENGVVYFEILEPGTDTAGFLGARWPENGEDAALPAKPGRGGDGGNIIANFDVAGHFDASGGRCGRSAGRVEGGRAGEPNPARWAVVNKVAERKVRLEYITNTSRPGRSEDAPQCPGEGTAGKPSRPSPSVVWHQQELLRGVVDHVRAVFLEENYDEAKRIVDMYVGERAINAELIDFSRKLNARRDYFGNAPNWVPNLTLEACLEALEKEADTAIPAIHLAKWMEKRKLEHDFSISEADGMIQKTNDRLSRDRKEYARNLSSLLSLENDARDIEHAIQKLSTEVAAREEQLRVQAAEDVKKRYERAWWKDLLGILADMWISSPVFQPGSRLLARGATVGAKVGEEDWESTFGAYSELLKEFNFDKLSESIKQLQDEMSKLDPSDPGSAREKSAALLDQAKFITKSAKAIHSRGRRILPNEAETRLKEVQEKFSKLKEMDKEFKRIGEEIRKLSQKQTKLASDLLKISQSVSDLTEAIVRHHLALDSLASRRAAAFAEHDEQSYNYVQQMGREAEERLRRYHYYVMRAYLYEAGHALRESTQYGDRPGLEWSLHRIMDDVSKANQLKFSESDLEIVKRLYVQEVRRVIGEVVDKVQRQLPRSWLIAPCDVSRQDLRILNEQGRVALDVARCIGLSRSLSRRAPRIIEFGVEGETSISARVPSQNQGPVMVRLILEHSGESLLSTGGKPDKVKHGLFAWEITYDVVNKKLYPDYQLDQTWFRLLRHTTDDSQRSDPAGLLINPGLEGSITLVKDVIGPDGQTAPIERLRLLVKYEH